MTTTYIMLKNYFVVFTGRQFNCRTLSELRRDQIGVGTSYTENAGDYTCRQNKELCELRSYEEIPIPGGDTSPALPPFNHHPTPSLSMVGLGTKTKTKKASPQPLLVCLCVWGGGMGWGGVDAHGVFSLFS